jgi:Flp pilus assembly protein TadG
MTPTTRVLHRLRLRGDGGNAMIEFVYLSVLLMVPLVYLLTTVFQVQRAAFGVTEAARQAGRAYATAEGAGAGAARASAAASLALDDQGLVLAEPVQVSAPDGLEPGAQVRVVVRHRVVLPLVGGLFRGVVPPSIPVQASHLAVVDRFKDP